MMRVSLPGYCNDFLSFLLFLRLGTVVFLCAGGAILTAKSYGPGYGVIAGCAAYPLWWYHFGLPRFKSGASGIFSAKFCLWGYIWMTVVLLVCVLEYFGILKEAAGPTPVSQEEWYSRRHIIRYVIIFCVLCAYAFFKKRFFDKKG